MDSYNQTVTFPSANAYQNYCLDLCRQYFAQCIWQQLSVEIPVVKEELVRGGLWNEAWTPAKIVGMILAAYPSVEDIYRLALDEKARADVALEALETLNRDYALSSIRDLLTAELTELLAEKWWPVGVGAAEIVAFINTVPLDLLELRLLASDSSCRAEAVVFALQDRGVTATV
jgi:hypothetical protein